VLLVKKDKTCSVSTAALKAFNAYSLNKQQNFNRDNTIDFNDANMQSKISKDAVSKH